MTEYLAGFAGGIVGGLLVLGGLVIWMAYQWHRYGP